QAEDGIRDKLVTGVQTCALPISRAIRIIKEIRAVIDRAYSSNASFAIKEGNIARFQVIHTFCDRAYFITANALGETELPPAMPRSEERRVGKEGRYRWWQDY